MQDLSIINNIIKAWNLPEAFSCEPVGGKAYIHRLRLAGGDTYYLKRRPSRFPAECESALLRWLLARGLPVAVPRLTVEGQPAALLGDELCSLFPALAGVITVDPYAPGAEERTFEFGAALARLHQALAYYPQTAGFPRLDLPGEMTGWISAEIERHAGALRGVLLEVCEFLDDYQAQVPAQLIHRDAHPSNLLMADGRVSGYLDFDFCCMGPRLFDPCYLLTGILSGEFDQGDYRQEWFSLVSALFRGYHSVQPLLEVERNGIVNMMLAIEVLFTAFGYRAGNEAMAKTNIEMIAWLLEHRALVEDTVRTVCLF